MPAAIASWPFWLASISVSKGWNPTPRPVPCSLQPMRRADAPAAKPDAGTLTIGAGSLPIWSEPDVQQIDDPQAGLIPLGGTPSPPLPFSGPHEDASLQRGLKALRALP